MQVWRLAKSRHARTAFDGEGARLYGARWNSRGTRVAYASSNSALAVLEVLVHMTAGGALTGYSLITARLHDSLIEDLPSSSLPEDWNVSPAPPSVQALGDTWVQSGRSLALRVPSVIVDAGFKILVNPQHEEFHKLAIESIAAFSIDPRLLR